MKLTLLAFATALFSGAQAAELKVHHRIWHPASPSQPWTEHGTLTVADNLAQLQTLSSPQLTPVKDVENSLYQVALQTEAAEIQAQWSVSSVKLCHLSKAKSQSLHLYLSSDDTPYSLDYFVSPIPHDGSCPDLESPSFDNLSLNTTIVLHRPRSPPLPELRAPPQLSEEGEVVQPIPEKSFIQKYWMYITMALLALALAGGDPEEGREPAK
ncbi:hypothetical protein BKA70DRAFT_1557617 [Coprinopsis sp. MPI-PUGE-AT-0042]|nr:hypothetical protein BKA70DRAFT_1557617 [Coprinopsis sp. MPI-PUGE-AT-0042]